MSGEIGDERIMPNKGAGNGGGARSAAAAGGKEERSSGRTAAARATDRRVVRTKAAIRDAFIELIHEQDYDKITVSAVARTANIDRKTFYLHYATVDDVLDEVLRQRAEGIVTVLRRESFLDGKTVDVSDLFAKLSVDLVHEFSFDKRMAQHMPTDLLLKKVEEPLTEALVEEDGLGLADMGPYLVYCVTFFCAGLLAVYRRWLITDSEIPLEDLSEVASAAAFAGVNGILENTAHLKDR